MTTRKHVFYGILALVSLLGLGITQSARAFTVTLEEVGSNVVATGSGAFNLTGLTLLGTAGGNATMGPSFAGLTLASGLVDRYRGVSGPTSFGSGGATFASSSSGAAVGIFGVFGNLHIGELFVPQGYPSHRR